MNLASALTDGFAKQIRVNQNTINLGNQLMFMGIVILEIPSNLILQRVRLNSFTKKISNSILITLSRLAQENGYLPKFSSSAWSLPYKSLSLIEPAFSCLVYFLVYRKLDTSQAPSTHYQHGTRDANSPKESPFSSSECLEETRSVHSSPVVSSNSADSED